MKIGFFADGYLPQKNGVATSVTEYADALQALGHEVTIIAPKYPGYKDRKKNVIRLSSINIKKEIGIRLALYLPEKAFVHLLRHDFDIIHGHGDGPITMLGWTIAKRKNIPFILSHHTFWNNYMHYFPGGKIINPDVVKKFTKLFANSCSYIISPSGLAKRELRKYGVTKPITVIPHGLDLTNYTKGDSTFLHKKAKIPKDNKILLFVGRLGKEKSIELLLKSFRIIHESMPNTSFVLVGEGPQRKVLENLAQELGISKNIHFFGEIDYKKIPSVFHSADLFLFSSKTETLGKVIIEAMAAGLPVVTLNIAPFKEMITQGKEGFLVQFNAASIARAALSILQDDKLQNEMSQNAKIKAETFSINNIIMKIESIYAKTIHSLELKRKRRITKIISRVRSFIEVEFH